MEIGGINIIETTAMVEFYRRPRTKKKRIINKWMKRDRNYRPRRDVMLCDNTLFVHPKFAPILYNQLEA